MAWPEHFPESCPPEDAEPALGSFYRLVDVPSSEEDFLSHLELKQLGIRNFRKFTDECVAAGLSVYSKVEDIYELQNLFPKMQSKAIAHGELTGDGVIKPTPTRGNSHHTWWLPLESEPQTYFTSVT
ncbi:hypothetical protein H7J86_11535 [Mycobacterium hackensackense]|uniref:hypothetical protein n=1 Tax=Mycobacterium hackensackense TaxID=228909 RepID=UPI0022659583|nr:hypothetical protein [Mycobacterium hackensackense]MCV7252797.1 hypothetical protein [Mycobacterium hackensackense]